MEYTSSTSKYSYAIVSVVDSCVLSAQQFADCIRAGTDETLAALTEIFQFHNVLIIMRSINKQKEPT